MSPGECVYMCLSVALSIPGPSALDCVVIFSSRWRDSLPCVGCGGQGAEAGFEQPVRSTNGSVRRHSGAVYAAHGHRCVCVCVSLLPLSLPILSALVCLCMIHRFYFRGVLL